MNANERINGFLVKRVTRMEKLRGMSYELLHEPSGARILHLHNDDAENLFSVTFPTPPPDDTGVPHILEHSVLAGSRRYRVKDPFFEMVKCSMATFINAMTGSDYTVYPVASNVRQDFHNLAEVYWDAVFHPLLTEKTFEREGHHLEFADKKDIGSDLIIKGIVYNEMKGARSSPEAKVSDLIEKRLWPDTPYGKDSGGDPDIIPELTWQGLRDFHRRFYQPANAFIFLYGDIPTADHLEFLEPRLKELASVRSDVKLPPQPRWKQPKTLTDVYPVGPTDEMGNKTFLSVNWLTGSGIDAAEIFAFSALHQMLLGNQSAPLRKALIDSKLGEDLSHSGFWANGIDTSFHIGLKGSEGDRAERFLKLVLDTLGEIADRGVTQEQFDSALQQLAYRYLEISPSFPLHVMGYVTSMWLHGADPLTLLHAEEHIQKLKDDFAANPRLFSDLIRRKLIDNPHRLMLVVRPDRDVQPRRDAEFLRKMKKLKESMSPAALEGIRKNQEELDALLDEPNSPEAIASLPQLRVKDLPAKPRHIKTSKENLPDGGMFLRSDVFANGVNYLQVSFDLTGLPPELYPYLPLFGDCVHKMGAAGEDYGAIAQRVAAFTGGVGFSVAISTRVDDPAKIVRQATFATKFLDDKADSALSLLRDLIFEIDPRDVPRLKDVLLQSRAHQQMRPTSDGMGLALRHAARGISLEGHLNEILGGIPQIQLFEKITEGSTDPLLEKIDAIRRFLLNSARVNVSFTGADKPADLVRRHVTEWSAAMQRKPIQDVGTDFRPWAAPPREGLAAPMDVAYCTMVMPSKHISDPDGPRLSVAARLLSLGYVLDEVRFKGTAYGGGCGYNGAGRVWTFNSYRDPWINRTLDVYSASLRHVKEANWTQGDVDRAIIGTAKEGERPIRPPQATGTSLWRYLLGDTPERRDARHAAMLGVTLADVRRVLIEQFESNYSKAAVCVTSSRKKLEEANSERPKEPLEISDILSNKTA